MNSLTDYRRTYTRALLQALQNSADRTRDWRREARAVLRLGVPLTATQIAQMAVLTADVIMIGRLGTEPLAAAALGTTTYFMVWMLASGPVGAVSPIIAQIIGKDPTERQQVTATARMGIWAVLLASVILAPVFIAARPMLQSLNQLPGLIEMVVPYIQILGLGLPFALAFGVLRNFVTALSRPNAALITVIITTLVNIALNYVLIYGNFGAPRLELVGAGIASAVSNVFGFGLLFMWIKISPFFRDFEITRNFFRADRDRFKEIFTLGIPIGFTMTFEGGLFIAGVFLMGLVSVSALAAHQVAVNVATLTFMVPFGMAMGGNVRVGMAAGARNPVWAKRASHATVALGCAFMALSALVMITFPETITSLFIDISDPEKAETVRLATIFLRIAAVFQLFDAVQVTAAHSLRGLKDARIPMWLAGFSYWGLGFPACLYFGFELEMEGTGIWIGFVLGLAAAAVAMAWRLHYMLKRFSHQVQADEIHLSPQVQTQ